MNRVNEKRGFTLIEMMISMAIFVVFLGVVFSAYSDVVQAQRDGSNIRKMYSGARGLFETLTEDIRLGTIDYYYYKCENSFSSADLVLLSKDGLLRTVYTVTGEKGSKTVKKAVSLRTDLTDTFGSGDYKTISAGDLKIGEFKFSFSPGKSPNASDTIYKFQPQVTITAEFVANENDEKFTIPLQTTISSRVYSKVDARERKADLLINETGCKL